MPCLLQILMIIEYPSQLLRCRSTLIHLWWILIYVEAPKVWRSFIIYWQSNCQFAHKCMKPYISTLGFWCWCTVGQKSLQPESIHDNLMSMIELHLMRIEDGDVQLNGNWWNWCYWCLTRHTDDALWCYFLLWMWMSRCGEPGGSCDVIFISTGTMMYWWCLVKWWYYDAVPRCPTICHYCLFYMYFNKLCTRVLNWNKLVVLMCTHV